MAAEAPDGSVRITLKDVYETNQLLASQVASAFADLRVTLANLGHHLESIDARNGAADQLHSDMSRRLSELEQAQVTGAAVRGYRDKAEQARKRSVGALVASGISAAGVVASFVALLHK